MIAKKPKKIKEKSDVFFQVAFSILTIFLVGFLLVSNVKIEKRRSEMSVRIDSLKKEIQTLQQKKDELESNLSQTGKESYWEEKIREEGYVKEGENPVVVMPPEKNQTGSEQKQEGFSAGLWEKIKGFFSSDIQK